MTPSLTLTPSLIIESRKLLTAMRAWVEDCATDDDDLYNREQATDAQIVAYVKQNYCGGVDAFTKDSLA